MSMEGFLAFVQAQVPHQQLSDGTRVAAKRLSNRWDRFAGSDPIPDLSAFVVVPAWQL